MQYTISWTRFKAIKVATPAAVIFYTPTVAGPSVSSPANNYLSLIGGANNQFICNISDPNDVTDFQTNFKAAATNVTNINDAISILVVL